MPYSTALVPGVRTNERRGISFLECPEDDFVDAKQVFEKLKDKQKRDLLSRFDHWLGHNHCDKYFHGWPNNPTYKECFVFKWKKAGTYHRLYGFLINPRPLTAPGFQVCVLVHHDRKNNEDTDFSILDRINKIKATQEARRAVSNLFPELREDNYGGITSNDGPRGVPLDRRKR